MSESSGLALIQLLESSGEERQKAIHVLAIRMLSNAASVMSELRATAINENTAPAPNPMFDESDVRLHAQEYLADAMADLMQELKAEIYKVKFRLAAYPTFSTD